jgi:acyl dehydratase
VVTFRHTGRNQEGEVVAVMLRSVLIHAAPEPS